MTLQRRQSQKKLGKSEQLGIVVRFLSAGKTQAEAANAVGVNIRTIQRWIADQEVKTKLEELQQQTDAVVKSDPLVLSVTQVRQQVNEILEYRESQRNFALEMGEVVKKASAVLLKALERAEANPDEFSARSIPPLMKAVADTAEKVSNAWARSTGLDDLLETLKDEPQAISQRETEA